MRHFVFISFFLIVAQFMEANENATKSAYINAFSTPFQNTKNKNLERVNQFQIFKNRPSPLFAKFRKKQKDNKRLTASVLAFPFPFGIVGLHRIYLGCPPYVPVVYIGTLGGVFGALPLIDFFVLVFDKDTDQYLNNEKVFMWVK